MKTLCDMPARGGWKSKRGRRKVIREVTETAQTSSTIHEELQQSRTIGPFKIKVLRHKLP